MLKAQHMADVVETKQRSVELEQRQVDRLRVKTELRACLLVVDRLMGECSAKDDKLGELASAVATEKLLHEEAIWDYLRLSVEGDKLQGQLVRVQADVSAYKNKLR